jgi:hypothetical protein
MIMSTDYDFRNTDLFGPVAFRPEFNNFQEINASQAWSLLFTGSNEDKVLGFNPESGRFFTNVLVAIVVSGALWSVFFTGFPY